MIKSNRHDKPQQPSDLQIVQNPDHKKKNNKKQDRYSTVTVHNTLYTCTQKTKFAVTFLCDKILLNFKVGMATPIVRRWLLYAPRPKMSQMNQGQISINCGTKDVETLSTYLMSFKKELKGP